MGHSGTRLVIGRDKYIYIYMYIYIDIDIDIWHMMFDVWMIHKSMVLIRRPTSLLCWKLEEKKSVFMVTRY